MQKCSRVGGGTQPGNGLTATAATFRFLLIVQLSFSIGFRWAKLCQRHVLSYYDKFGSWASAFGDEEIRMRGWYGKKLMMGEVIINFGIGAALLSRLFWQLPRHHWLRGGVCVWKLLKWSLNRLFSSVLTPDYSWLANYTIRRVGVPDLVQNRFPKHPHRSVGVIHDIELRKKNLLTSPPTPPPGAGLS